MGPHIAAPVTSVAELPGQSDRRQSSRIPTLFSLPYSGMDSGQMLIGDDIVTNPLTGRDRYSRESIGQTRHGTGPLCRPSWREGATVRCPEPDLLGCGTSIWGEAGDPEVGGAESSAILLVESRYPLKPQRRHLRL